MKRIFLFLIIFSITHQLSQAQNKLTLEDIWKTYKYYPMGLPPVYHSKSDNYFLLYEYPNILKIDYKLASFDTLLNCSKLPNVQIDDFISNGKENKLLLATHSKAIRRSSEKAIYYEYSCELNELKAFIDSNTYIQNPTFSRDYNSVCFYKDNNLYIKTNTNEIQQITSDGKENEIINGLADWVNEEEFDLLQAFTWSPDSKNIGYLKFNETNVPMYQIPVYDSAYPTYINFKYPKAGNVNSKITAHIYSIETKKTIDLPIPFPYEYIPEIKWIDSVRIALTLLNRHQDTIQIYMININDLQSKIIYSYSTKTYIDIPSYFTPIANSDLFIIRNDSDGFNNLYVYSYTKGFQNQLTKDIGDITKVYGYYPKQNKVIYQATNRMPTERYVFSNSLSGNTQHIFSNEPGTHDISINSDGNHWIHEYSNLDPTLSICFESTDTSQNNTCVDNKWMLKLAKEMNFSIPKIFTIHTKSGEDLYAYYILPHNYKKNKKYPTIVTVYGGPSMQKVTNEWTYDYYWQQYLAQEGYVVIAVDCRGTDARGSKFRKQTYKNLGEMEASDIAETSTFIKNLKFVDPKNIAIQGWSYGGYISLLTVAKYPNAYKAAIAIAPVSNWANYDNIYTERYMQSPQENSMGYKKSSVLTYANNITAKVLLAHGTGDDNVHPQNSFELARKFIDTDVDFDFLIFPNDEHGLYGNNSRMYLYKNIIEFLNHELKGKE